MCTRSWHLAVCQPAAEVRPRHLGPCRAEVQSNLPVAGEGGAGRTELLCNVRGLLKKIKQSVLVGDRVRVAGIDWEDFRGGLPRMPGSGMRPVLGHSCAAGCMSGDTCMQSCTWYVWMGSGQGLTVKRYLCAK